MRSLYRQNRVGAPGETHPWNLPNVRTMLLEHSQSHSFQILNVLVALCALFMDYFMTRIGWLMYDRCRRSGGRDLGFNTTHPRRIRCAYLLHSRDGANWLAGVEEGAMLRAIKLKLEFMGIEIDLEEDPRPCPQGIQPSTFPSRSRPIPYQPSPPHPTHYSVQPPPIPTQPTLEPAYDFSGFATTMNTSATSVETIKSPLKDGDTGVTRTQRRGWEFHQLGRRLGCLAFLLRVWMEGQMFRLSFYVALTDRHIQPQQPNRNSQSQCQQRPPNPPFL
ncbi:hypothetical protein M422DRAFT_253927 [Sphaerobolus stellatus SS14]|uniref:Uncharacterized protein n=1 Tax=Sphaerobolus stellatus (strain SS14) TaxID=990650 RepID=A0A0C9V769_SPHS4|nr:hypothetical protein M422DRAFT_253927 [Sphaerobolus stellatus SS14]